MNTDGKKVIENFKIEIDGKLFQKAYLIYVIKIIHIQDNYFYIGQTGDRHYVTARPAFRRLAAHLSDRKATDNQIYKQIARKILKLDFRDDEKFSEDIKNKVSDFLIKSKINMNIFSLKTFNESIDKKSHQEYLKYVEDIEKYVIDKMKAKFGKENILNIKFEEPKGINDSEKQAEDIIKHF